MDRFLRKMPVRSQTRRGEFGAITNESPAAQ